MPELELEEELLDKLKKLVADDKLSDALEMVLQMSFEKGLHQNWESEEVSKALLDGNQPS